MVVVPADTPVTTPVPETVATMVVLLFQVPPPPSLNVVVKPTHTDIVPDIADGSGFTVTIAEALHPVLKV